MAYIYKIVNDINDRIYIGKTMHTPEERFKQHCRDSKKERCEKRPLYDAMNKYGVEHFHIETIEECSDTIVNDRETYWIEKYGSFKNGYNATTGGDGKHYLDYDLIVATYDNIKTFSGTAKQLGISEDTVSKVIKERNIPLYNPYLNTYKAVDMFDKNDNYIRSFSTTTEAAKFLIQETGKNVVLQGVATHITACCKGKRQTVYGYKWRYHTEIN